MKYVVKRYWELCDSVEVDADSPSQAIELAHEMPVDNARAMFVPDSMNSDPETDVQRLVPSHQGDSLAERRP